MSPGVAIVASMAAIIGCGYAQAAGSMPPSVTVDIDLSAAEAILAAATSDPDHAAEAADAALRIPQVSTQRYSCGVRGLPP